jgi:2'-5' RNA ligase
MSRLFIGVVPAALADNREFKILRGKLKRTAADLDLPVKWTPPELWHVTLLFLGEGPTAEEAAEALQSWTPSTATDLNLRLQGLGAFASPQEARVLWLGVQASQELLDLQEDLEKHFRQRFVLPDEERDFHPHLSLARFRNPTAIHRLIDLGARKHFGDYPVGEVLLVESVIQNQMPKYIIRRRRTLR